MSREELDSLLLTRGPKEDFHLFHSILFICVLYVCKYVLCVLVFIWRDHVFSPSSEFTDSQYIRGSCRP